MILINSFSFVDKLFKKKQLFNPTEVAIEINEFYQI